jgi:hypothetical protein
VPQPKIAARASPRRGALRLLKARTAERRLSPRQICDGLESVEESSCRMFLCVRCRCLVLVCRRCDRGQIYCAGTCAQKARRHRQRQARRDYQATPRGRALHAERNRRYRARQRHLVMDQGCAKEPEARPSLGSSVNAALSDPSRRKPSEHAHCHYRGCLASLFVRQSPLRSRRRRPAQPHHSRPTWSSALDTDRCKQVVKSAGGYRPGPLALTVSACRSL